MDLLGAVCRATGHKKYTVRTRDTSTKSARKLTCLVPKKEVQKENRYICSTEYGGQHPKPNHEGPI